MKKTLTAILLVSLLTSCRVASNPNPAKSAAVEVNRNKKLWIRNEEGYIDFYEAIKSGHIVIATFGLDSSTDSIEVNQILISLMPTYDKSIHFSKVDLKQDRTSKKNYKIATIPTIIFFDKDGQEFYRLEGNVTSKMIVDKLESFCWSY